MKTSTVSDSTFGSQEVRLADDDTLGAAVGVLERGLLFVDERIGDLVELYGRVRSVPRANHQIGEKVLSHVGDVVDGALEDLLVRLGRSAVPADLADVLAGSRLALLPRHLGLGTTQRDDASAHAPSLAPGRPIAARVTFAA